MKRYSIVDVPSFNESVADFCQRLSTVGISETCLFDCKLAFCELASNALKHAGGGSIRVCVAEKEIEIILVGYFEAPEKSVCSPVLEESGRGLYLIDSVCLRRENTSEGLKVVIVRK